MNLLLKYTVAIAAIMVPASIVNASPIIGWVFVAPNGNDTTCKTQLSTDGSVLAPALTVPPCKTFTHACALMPADAGNWVLQAQPGTYTEAVVCKVSGHNPDNPFWIVGRNPGPGGGGGGPMYLKSPDMRPAWEMTGSFNYLNKFSFSGSPGDALYVHGINQDQEVNDNVIGYNTAFANNGGYAVHADYTYWFIMYNDTIGENANNVESKSCILIESSIYWTIRGTSIYRCGSSTGIPQPPKPGIVATDTTYGYLATSVLQEYATPNLVLNDSYFATVVKNAVAPKQVPFSYQVNSRVSAAQAAYEASTDIFLGN